ncbi:MAG TPA: PadR family transcriptional regulator [Acidimicrobiales bacterium]|nr:PadR family transcriptional regulator [Acidimicrobiales bacterium]
MSDTPSTTSHALLGLLALQRWSTYELAKQVRRSLGWFWPRAERKLYDEPKRLVAAGLATASSEMTGARPRTVYAITARGRTSLRRWLDEPPAPPSLEFEGLVKVFFADSGTLEQLRRNLTTIAETADRRLDELEARAAENRGGDVAFPQRLHLNTIALKYELDQERATAAWARWALSEIAGWRSTTDPGAWDHRRALPPSS